MPYGLAAMLKEGHKHLEEPVIKNIEACKQLSELTRTSMGPQGASICAAHLLFHPGLIKASEIDVREPHRNE